MMKRVSFFILVAWCLLSSKAAFAQDDEEKGPVINELDDVLLNGTSTVMFGLGTGSGKITLANNSQVDVSGSQFGLSYFWNQQNRKMEWFTELSFLLDSNKNQLVRQTIGVGFYYYLLGAKPYWSHKFNTLATRASSNTFGLGLIGAVRQESYNITPIKTGVPEVSGSTLALVTGFFARYALSTKLNLGFQMLLPLQSFAASSERISAGVTEFGIFISSRL